MPARARLNDLAAQKRALVLQADLHRQLILAEFVRLEQRVALVQEQIAHRRWWWMGGSLLAAWFVTRRLSGIGRWLPVATVVARLVRGFSR